MDLEKFTGGGSTPSRRRFWDQAAQSVMSLQKIGGRNVTVDEHPGKGSVINIADTSARRAGPGPVLNCPTGDTITVTFSDIVSCGCLTDGTLSYMGTDLGGINAPFTLTRFSPTEFSVTDNLFNYKRWSSTDCSGSPTIDENNDIIVYARCIEASGVWTVSIQDTTTFFFAFFASDAATTLTNETSCSPFTHTDLFHNGTAIVTF